MTSKKTIMSACIITIISGLSVFILYSKIIPGSFYYNKPTVIYFIFLVVAFINGGAVAHLTYICLDKRSNISRFIYGFLSAMISVFLMYFIVGVLIVNVYGS